MNNIKRVLVIAILITYYLNAHSQSDIERHPAFRDIKRAELSYLRYIGSTNVVNIPFKEVMSRLLEYSGISLDTTNSDLKVKVGVYGTGIKAHYALPGSIGYQYTGATLEVQVTFETLKGEIFKENFKETVNPKSSISKTYNTPDDAPYLEAYYLFLPNLLKMIYKYLGKQPLLAALQDKDIMVSISSTKTIATIDTTWIKSGTAKSIVPKYIETLKNSDYIIRIAAIEALEILKDDRAMTPLISLLSDPDVSDEATKALNRINLEWIKSDAAKIAVPKLILALKNRYGEVNGSVIEALGNLKDPRALEPLIACLNNESEYIQIEAIKAIENIHDKAAVAPLIHFLIDNNIQDEVIKALQTIDPDWATSAAAKSAVQTLINALNDKNLKIRLAATKALGIIKDSRAVDPLILKLKDQEMNERAEAINSLGLIKDSRSVEPLLGLVKDKEYWVRLASINALKNIKDNRAIEPLVIALLDDSDQSLSDEAEMALDTIDPNWRDLDITKKHIPIFVAALIDQDLNFQYYVEKGLEIIDPAWENLDATKNAVPEFITVLLNSKIASTRIKISNLLGSIKDQRAIEPLINILKDQNQSIREAASKALYNITGEQFGYNFTDWQKWWEKNKI